MLKRKENPFIVKELDSNTYDFFDFSKKFFGFSHSRNESSISIKETIFYFNKPLFIHDKGYFIDFLGKIGQSKIDTYHFNTTAYSFGVQVGKKFSKNLYYL